MPPRATPTNRQTNHRPTVSREPPTVNCEPLIWGQGLEPEAVNQMLEACRLPVSLAGALMPDAHIGYGLPIGGVLATDNSVIPYGVGVDIACRMKMSVLDWNPSLIAGMRGRGSSNEPDKSQTEFYLERRAETAG